jgi:peptidoglycan LD-endopeptidase LytH
MQRLVLGAVILIIVAMLVFFAAMIWSAPAPAPAPQTGAAPAEAPAAGLIIPVQGVRADQLSDTYSQARAGGARVHDAIDIMAPRGTPVAAAAAGTVEKLFFSHGGGGITVYVRSVDGRWSYYYAHLDAYAPGLREGQRLARGDPVGTVGSTGNASPAGPHLHFAINLMGPNDRWWQGRPVNPYPLLAAGGARR